MINRPMFGHGETSIIMKPVREAKGRSRAAVPLKKNKLPLISTLINE
jgi:hypothetical protein